MYISAFTSGKSETLSLESMGKSWKLCDAHHQAGMIFYNIIPAFLAQKDLVSQEANINLRQNSHQQEASYPGIAALGVV